MPYRLARPRRDAVIPRKLAWYDALGLPTGALAFWPDKSGNGNDTQVQGTGTARATVTANQLNGRPTVLFDGGDQYQLPSAVTRMTQGANTLIALANSTDDTTVQRIVRINRLAATAGALGLAYSNVSGQVIYVHGGTNLVVSGVTKSNYNLFACRHANGIAQAVSVNGAAESTDALGYDFEVDTGGWIGATLGTSQWLTGGIAELRIYDYALSYAELRRELADIAQRWGGLTLQ